MRRAASVCALVILATVGFLGMNASPALAHNTFDGSSPAEGEVLAASPATWTVRFAKSVPLVSASGSVVDGDGTRTSLTTPRHGESDSVIVFDLPTGLEGAVTARWRLVSTDGHVISGRVGFTVSPGPAPTQPAVSPGATTATTPAPSTVPVAPVAAEDNEDTGVPQPARTALRLLNYLSIVLLGGIFFVDLDIASGALMTVRGRRLAAWGVSGAAVIPGIQFLVFVDDLRTAGTGLVGAVMDSLSLTPGAMLALRTVTGTAAAVLVFGALRAGRLERPLLRLLGVLSVAYLVALAYVGHSRSRSFPLLGVPADVLHTAAAAVWLGGLAALLFVVVPVVQGDSALVAFRRFGVPAQRAVAVIAVTGVVQTARLHGGVTSLFTGGHGLLLLAKVSLVAMMLRLAARNRRLLHSGAAPGGLRAGRTREIVLRATAREAALGLGVIALTAVLVAVSPG